MSGETGCEDLGLGLQPPEGSGMDYAVAVALESVAVGMFGFGVTPAPTSIHREPQARQHRSVSRPTARQSRRRFEAPPGPPARAGCAADPEVCAPRRASSA